MIPLRPGDVEVGRLDEPQQDVSTFRRRSRPGQGRGVRDAERHVQDPGERLGEQRLAGAGGADEQDVRL